jgi:putative ABC transport system permease protein
MCKDMRVKRNIVKPRWRKVLADLWDNKMRSLLVVSSIAVGVFAVGTIASTYLIISRDIGISYASAHPANIQIWTDPFDKDLLRSIAKVPGVADAEGRQVLEVRVSEDGETWYTYDLFALQSFVDSDINLRFPIEGALVPERYELVIEENPMKENGFGVGDNLQIKLQDESIREVPVVGIVLGQSGGVGDFLSSPKGYITMDTMEWLGQPDYLNRLYVTVSGDSNDEQVIAGVSEVIEDKVEKSGRQVYRTQLNKTNEHPMASIALAILGVLGALGVLILLLSSSLIVNTLNGLLSQHLRQIGVMKLVGARSYQILGMYLILLLSFSGISLAIAIPLGARAGYSFAEFIANFLSFNLLGYRIVPEALLLQVLVALIIPLGAGYIPVRRGSKTKVRRAISEDRAGDQPASIGWLDRLGRRVSWITRPVLLSIRNTFRQRGRLLLTLFTLTMGGAIFVAVFNVRDSMDQYMDQLGEYFLADVTLNFERPYRISEVEQAVYQVPGVEYLEAWAGAGADILDSNDKVMDTMFFLGPPSDSTLIDPYILSGRWLLPGEEKKMTVSDSIWEVYPDLQPGDTLRIKIQGMRTEEWEVVGIFRFTSQADSVLGYSNYEYLSEVLHMTNRSVSFRVVTKEHNLYYQEKIGVEIDQHLSDLGFHVSDVEAGLSTLGEATEAINILVIFLLIMAFLTAFVGSIGLTGTMGMNVLERTREIGVMRAIGAVDMEIIRSVIVEGVLIGIISWFLGAILSFPISYLLLTIVSLAMFNATVPLALTFQGFLFWLGVVLVLSVLASVLPARNAARLTIREVLAYE